MIERFLAERWSAGQDPTPGGTQHQGGGSRHHHFPPWTSGHTRMECSIYYGPWQCLDKYSKECEAKCKADGVKYCGCIWIADLVCDFYHRGVLQIDAGTRLAITQCICDYPKRSKEELEDARKKWEKARKEIRDKHEKNAKKPWPKNPDGSYMDGHHLRDLLHGGDPTDDDNVIPVPKDVHTDLNKAYRDAYKCDGASQWAKSVPDSSPRPYKDQPRG